MRRIILAVETSCDDTAIAISEGQKILASEAATSLKQHTKYGGVVPEVAARNHEEKIAKIFSRVIPKNKKITHVAYTNEPGLPGSLHIGKIFAKSIANLLEVPAVPINHMMGHVFSFWINKETKIEFPFLGVVISGGHTIIYKFTDVDKYIVLNETTDDPIGECLDKIGRILNLPYPGGISLDNIYQEDKTNFKLIQHYKPEEKFSFSGLKTHIGNMVNQAKMKNNQIDKVLIGSSALKWVVDEVLIKIKYYQKKENISTVVIGGGVSANNLLRKELKKQKINVLIPEKKYSGDNAEMIANYAEILLNKK